jgi:hypothetical protein
MVGAVENVAEDLGEVRSCWLAIGFEANRTGIDVDVNGRNLPRTALLVQITCPRSRVMTLSRSLISSLAILNEKAYGSVRSSRLHV